MSKPSPSRALGGEQHAGLLLREELGERGDDDGGDHVEDEGPHLLVALEAGEGLAHGSSRRPADKIKSDAFPKSCCLHGEGGGAEDLLVLHLVGRHEDLDSQL